jgi:serine/threonine-protein phosphatase 2A regulatory subunit B
MKANKETLQKDGQENIPSTTIMKIMEWKFNQFVGEKLNEVDFRDEENQSYIITEMAMTNTGDYLLLGDRGGRIIMFRKGYKGGLPKLNYFYEFNAFEKDFDVHKSKEYSEQLRGLCTLPMTSYNKVDVLSCSYRTVKLHRVHNIKVKDWEEESDLLCGKVSKQHSVASTSSSYSNGEEDEDSEKTIPMKDLNLGEKLFVPRVKSIKYDIGTKCRKVIKIPNSEEINSISYNPKTENFITSDNSSVLLFDLNTASEAFTIGSLCSDNNYEKITKCAFSSSNSHLFSFGTNTGKINMCDIRTGSDCMKFAQTYKDEFSALNSAGFNLNNSPFAYQITAVHDINMNFSNPYLFATRHYLSVNLWDMRKITESINQPTQTTTKPLNKFLIYEPIIPKLSALFKKGLMNSDKFSLNVDKTGKFLLTGGYNNMFHVFDVEQKLNTHVTIDECNEKLMQTNIIRKINSKGSCLYKKEDFENLNFNNKIVKQVYCPVDNFIVMGVQNCMYTYSGNVISKETAKK